MTQGVKVRHSLFIECTGIAIRETRKETRTGKVYPACEVIWDANFGTILDSIMANYNLVFIVPAGRRVVS